MLVADDEQVHRRGNGFVGWLRRIKQVKAVRISKGIIVYPPAFSKKALPKWQIAIIEKYPLLYLERDTDIPYADEEPCNLRYGFEFGEGWAELADVFSATASDLITQLRQHSVQPDAFIHAFIFKEKMGMLIWQGYHNLSKPFSTLLSSYAHSIMQDSQHVCEKCGRAGRLREKNGWYMVRCDAYFPRGKK